MTFEEIIRLSAEEGAVLLKNEEELLPLTTKDNVAVFGRCQLEYYRSGTGSGGSVHVKYTTNLIDSLHDLEKENKAPKINLETENTYRAWIKEHPFETGGNVWAGEPWCQEEMPLSEETVNVAKKSCNKAVFVIGRTAGEDKDNKAEEGSWYLTKTEKESVRTVCKAFSSVCLVMNVSNIMDLSWLSEKDFASIKSVIFTWHGGMEGGRAAANLLCGITTPSGKLTDTIAKNISDYPCSNHFGNSERNFYAEDIYVGYRYFSTFCPEKILYPFGFGLSYTNFTCSYSASSSGSGKETEITVKAKVKNTGSFAGKETVQIYAECPQGELGKAKRVLLAFKKTKLLSPKEEEEITLKIKLSDCASYDDRNASKTSYSWILEKGQYKFFAGTDSLSAKELVFEKAPVLEETLVTEKLSQAAAPTQAFKRLKPLFDRIDGNDVNGKAKDSWEDTPLLKVDMEERIKANLPQAIEYKGNKGITYKDLLKSPEKLDDFISQLNENQLATMVRGEGMISQKVTVGIAAAYGGVSQELHDLGIPCAGCADGPSGLRLDTGKEARLMPIGTLLACTWNPDLVEELYTEEGKELVEYKVDSLLGPGVNIHRSPLNGRNFEYYSEDPLLSGIIATAALRGLNKGGSTGTIKHYAANNQELARSVSDSIVSERALREIYLKAFEIAVKSGEAHSLMTSYNPVNGHQAASNYDLIKTILRKEWGYKGLVMTDWWAKMNDCAKGGKASIRHNASMVRAGSDVYMVVDNDTAHTNGYNDDIPSSLENGKLTLGELQESVRHILSFLMLAPVSKRPLRTLKIIKEFTTDISSAPQGQKIVCEKDDFVPEEGSCVYFHAEKEATYTISGSYIKTGDTLAQSVTVIRINGDIAASLECRSTAGILISVNAAQVVLKEGFYKITMEHTKGGIEVKKLHISSEVITPVTLGIYD